MAFKLGIDAVVKMGSHADPTTVVDKSSNLKGVKTDEQVGTEDVTVLGAADRAKLLAYLNNSMTVNLDALWDKPTGAFWRHIGAIIRGADIVNFEIYPSGTASGSEKWSFQALVTNRSRTFGSAEVDKGAITIERTGTITETTV